MKLSRRDKNDLKLLKTKHIDNFLKRKPKLKPIKCLGAKNITNKRVELNIWLTDEKNVF